MKPPKGQKLWVSYRDTGGKVKWIITSDPMRTAYTLWRVGKNGELEKRKTAKSPKDFDAIAKGDLKGGGLN